MPRTSFVGREHELAALRDALDAAELVTVVGPGGAGKTRLVRELIREDSAAIFCDVSETSSVDAMRIAVSRALALDRVDALSTALAKLPPGVVVLDNLEQLLPEAADILDGWIEAAPDLTFVVTSRTPTHLGGERLVEVAPLPRDAARTLFLDRARALSPSLPADDESIAQIVERLDRLPLAIELAATRVRVLRVDQIAAQLGDKLDLLASRDPQKPERHATLRGAVAWSWRLLGTDEQTALCDLSLFRGWFDLDAATAVVGSTALDAVQALVDHALLVADDGRFRLFECVRDYGRELGPGDEARERHDAYFEQVGDVAGAMHDLIDVHRRAVENGSADRALRIALALEPVLLTRGPAALLLRLLDEAIAIAGDDSAALGAAHLARGHALADLGRFAESGPARERALEVARAQSDRLLEGKALASLGRHAWHSGDFSGALERSDAAIAVFDTLGEERLLAETRSHRANFRWLEGHVEEARRDYLDVLAILSHHDDRRAEAIALGNLASLERDMGFMAEAREHFARSLAMLEALDDKFHRGTFHMNFAGLLLETGDAAAAREELDAALALHRETGNRRWEGLAAAWLAQCDEADGDAAGATSRYVAAVELAERFGHPVMHAMVLCWRARHAAETGDRALASTCVERAEAAFASIGETVVDGLLHVARGHLAIADGDAERARSIAGTLRSEGATKRSGDLRMAVDRLEAALPTERSGLTIAAEALRFRAPGGAWQDISKRRAMRRILLALARHRETSPGEILTREALVEAGWPDEQIHTEAAATRVYTAIASLRRMGLKRVLLRRDDGYLLDPDVPFDWA